MTVTIDRSYRDLGDRPLYHVYPGQERPQDAFVQLGQGGEVCVGWSGEPSGNIPESVWHRQEIRIGVAPSLTADDIDDLLDEVEPLLKRVHAGHVIEWDGANHVGRLDEDAHEALGMLEQIAGEWEPTVCCDEGEDLVEQLPASAREWWGQLAPGQQDRYFELANVEGVDCALEQIETDMQSEQTD